ncbi:hypothetical protein TMES_12460 [Thalassospira mesophila]|uniref:YchJ-like middle NTF2-like domain-containing protein n=1 Tax=Thalassospira mesophila TaxID=1293891 RepID=A0A1Y2L1Y4_9PROT|nr:hypothetical protein TMES_12460 [Thalassospira mesophila]
MVSACPCGTERPYGQCCKPFHDNAQLPATAEQLMRSRYSAFALGLGHYLAHTVPAEKAATYNFDDIARQQTRWTSLEIVRTDAGSATDNVGYVEFIARFIENGQAGFQHEKSRFLRKNGKWLYIDGVNPLQSTRSAPSLNDATITQPASPVPEASLAGKTITTPTVGRNDPCPCGSGRKYKKCCGG